MLTIEQEVWLRAYCATLAWHGETIPHATLIAVANLAVEDFGRRFPQPKEVDYRTNARPGTPFQE